MLTGDGEQALEIGDLGRDPGELDQDGLVLAHPLQGATEVSLRRLVA
jgi:hypothetical protein